MTDDNPTTTNVPTQSSSVPTQSSNVPTQSSDVPTQSSDVPISFGKEDVLAKNPTYNVVLDPVFENNTKEVKKDTPVYTAKEFEKKVSDAETALDSVGSEKEKCILATLDNKNQIMGFATARTAAKLCAKLVRENFGTRAHAYWLRRFNTYTGIMDRRSVNGYSLEAAEIKKGLLSD